MTTQALNVPLYSSNVFFSILLIKPPLCNSTATDHMGASYHKKVQMQVWMQQGAPL